MRKHLLKFAALAVVMLAALSVGRAQNNVPITLNEGWNWIIYPNSESMSISEALADFTPMAGDIIKSRNNGTTQYINGQWRGLLTTFLPGQGYHYYSTYNGTRILIFSGGATNNPSALPEAAMDGEFTVDANGTKVRFSPGNLQCLIDPDMNKEAVVGTTGTSTSYQYPYNTYYNYSLCEMLYTADELAAAGLAPGPIKSIAFQSNSDLCLQRNNIRVWIANTMFTAVGSTSVSTSGMTKVFEGSVTQQPGWTEIPCGSTFRWDGTSNVRVTVVMNHGSWDYTVVNWCRHSTSFTSCGYACTDGNAYAPEANSYSLNTASYRPNIRFKGNGVRWRFAENQTDYIGEANANIGPNYNGWIDYFGWGTSGYNHGAVSYQPWSTSTTNSDYYAYGSATYNLNDQTGQADWGYNPISNGGNQENQWRTLTHNEWKYVFNTRTTSSGKRYAKAQVDGINGVILLPDNWQTSYYSLSSTNTSSANYSSNTIDASQWATLEQHGAVFLPAAGFRNGPTSFFSGSNYYWSATCVPNNGMASSVRFSDGLFSFYDLDRRRGAAVRLVCQSNPRIRTIGVSNVTMNTATVTAEVDYTGSATVGTRGVCWSTTPGPTASGSHTTSGSGTGAYTVNLSDLYEGGTTYYVRAYATIGGNTVYGNELTFITQAPVVVFTGSVSSIKQTSAIGSGSLSGGGITTMTELGICWSTNPNPTKSGRHATSNSTVVGNFTCNMTGLTPSTTYYVRAYATNNVDTSYGDEVSFTTSAVAAPSVTTSAVTNITRFTATAGGTVTNEGGAPVTERGICWSTSSSPTISDNHVSGGTGTGNFTCNMTGLNAGTYYYVRAYATNSQGTSYGSQTTFTTVAPPTGTINGLFSVSATQQVFFSRGNLQYQASTYTWRFAGNQYDYRGSYNSNISSTYSGWIDLFGWGTSGYNHGAVCYQPWSTSQTDSDYYAYGISACDLHEYTGKADWGYSPISNGGNQTNQWRTLTKNEWMYVLSTRSTASGIRFAKAQVAGVNGVILLPDNWSSSTYGLSNTNQGTDSYASNTISASQWVTLENAGAVFLPAAGVRFLTSVESVGSYGYYWTESQSSDNGAYIMYFNNGSIHSWGYGSRHIGYSVRLVRNAE